MKLAGFLTGAGVAGLAVWGFTAWRHVSDLDRLTAVVSDHCIPYVETGETPFVGMGRPVGVYDDAGLSDSITDGGNAVLYDNRFVAQWGNSTDANSDVRVCQVNDSYAVADTVGFVIDDLHSLHELIDTTVLADKGIVATSDANTSLWIWEPPAEAERFSGLRVILSVLNGGVSSVLVVNDAD